MALAKHHRPSFPPGLCSCLSLQSEREVPWLQERQGGSTSLLQTAAQGGGSVLQCCDRLCWSRRGATCSPAPGAAGPACPCRAKAGTSRQEQTGTWWKPGSRAQTRALRAAGQCCSGGGGCTTSSPQPVARAGQQPCHRGKEHRTESMTCKPSSLAASCDPRGPISSLSKAGPHSNPLQRGNLSQGRQDFGQALPSYLPAAPNLHSKPRMEVLQRLHVQKHEDLRVCDLIRHCISSSLFAACSPWGGDPSLLVPLHLSAVQAVIKRRSDPRSSGLQPSPTAQQQERRESPAVQGRSWLSRAAHAVLLSFPDWHSWSSWTP